MAVGFARLESADVLLSFFLPHHTSMVKATISLIAAKDLPRTPQQLNLPTAQNSGRKPQAVSAGSLNPEAQKGLKLELMKSFF